MKKRATARKRKAPTSIGSRVARVAYVASPFGQVESLIGAMANPESGIKFVLGIAKKAGQRISEVQSVLFDRVKWTADSAKDWLHEHGFTSSGKDEGATFWRFRQNDPKRYKEFRTVVPGTNRNPADTYRSDAYRAGRAALKYGASQHGTVNLTPSITDKVEWGHAWHDFMRGWRDEQRVKENPTPGESIEAYDEHLVTTMDPAFQAASPDEQAAAMTVQDATENPETGAVELFREFHGREPESTKTVVSEEHEHEWMTELGPLEELVVETLSGLKATIRFSGKDMPSLASSEDGKQLFIVGPVDLDLKTLRMSGPKWKKDLMTLGTLVQFTYTAQKDHINGKKTSYYHNTAEAGGPTKPMLLYKPQNRELLISGGNYHTTSAGVEN